MKLQTLAKLLGVAALSGLMSVSAHAAACGTTVGLDTSDVTFSGDGPDATGTASDNCFGVVAGNDSNSAVNSGSGMFGSTTWAQLTKYDADEGVTAGAQISGVSFSLVYGGLSGGFHQYTLVANDVGDPLPLPAVFDFAVVIKQGGGGNSDGGWAAYYFDDAIVQEGNNLGTFRTTFGPGTNDFSHFAVYGTGTTTDCPPTDPRCGENQVPEPGTLALFGLALTGLAIGRRRLSR